MYKKRGINMVKKRDVLQLLLDAGLIASSYYIVAFILRRFSIGISSLDLAVSFLIVITVQLSISVMVNVYRSLWKYTSIIEVVRIGLSVLVATVVLYLFNFLTKLISFNQTEIIISQMLVMILFIAVRASYRVYRVAAFYDFSRTKNKGQRVLIIGAGEAGAMIVKDIARNPNSTMNVIGILDDDVNKVGKDLHRVSILGTTDKIKEVVKTQNIEMIIFAIPSASSKKVKEVVSEVSEFKLEIKILPSISEMSNDVVSLSKLHSVRITDLLGREEVELNTTEISEYLSNEIVMVTGGGGSIGSELCRQIMKYQPKQLIILDNYENNAYELQLELQRRYPNTNTKLEVLIANIRESKRIEQIFDEYRPEIIFHAAAHKHVPLMEKSPLEAIKNNVLGTYNVAKAADSFGAKRFILISTDKAVNPTNVMGATKRVAEIVIQTFGKDSNTRFSAVRFGNVLGSNGSVIPIFKKQISEGGPVTVTHPEITRYFMTIPEAAMLVLQAGYYAGEGKIFILDMGEPIKIVDLAHQLIKLAGFEPNVDIPITYTGLRPGEKMYEELLLDTENTHKTDNEKIFIENSVDDFKKFKLKDFSDLKSFDKTHKMLVEYVPTFDHK